MASNTEIHVKENVQHKLQKSVQCQASKVFDANHYLVNFLDARQLPTGISLGIPLEYMCHFLKRIPFAPYIHKGQKRREKKTQKKMRKKDEKKSCEKKM